MTNKTELFGGKETEIKNKFESDNYNWETVKSQLEEISEKEQIDAKLEDLEDNVDSYYEYLKGLVDKKRSGSLAAAGEKIKTKAQEEKKELLSQVDKSIEEKGGLVGTLVGWLGGGSTLLGWIDEEKSLDPEAGMIDRFSTKFFAWIATTALGWLGIKTLSDSGETKPEEKPSDDKDKLDSQPKLDEKDKKTFKYQTIINLFTGLFLDDKNNQVKAVLYSDSFKNLTYKELVEIYKDPASTNPKYRKLMEDDFSQDRESVIEAIKLIVEGKGNETIKSILEKDEEHVNKYEEYTVEEIFLITSRDFLLLADIGELGFGVGNIDFSNFSEGSDLDPGLKNLGLNTKILGLFGGGYSFEGGKDNILKKISSRVDYSGNDLEAINKIIDFGLTFQEELKTNEKLQISDQIKISEVLKKPLQIEDVLKFYIITRGKTSFDDLNPVQQSIIYFSIPDLINDRGDYEGAGSYSAAIIGGILKSTEDSLDKSTQKIPSGVKSLLKDSLNKVIDVTSSTLKKFIKSIVGAFKENKKVGIGILGLLAVAPIFSKRTNVLNMIFKK